MRKHHLATELRAKQTLAGLVPDDVIASVPDDVIIDAYITCSCCGTKQVTDTAELDRIVASVADADEFLSACDAHSFAIGSHS